MTVFTFPASLTLPIVLLPLFGFLLIHLFKNSLKGVTAGYLATGVMACCFALSAVLFFNLGDAPVEQNIFDWINVGDLHIPFAFYADHISAVMLLIITGVGFLIHLYSIGYMHHDEGVARFFSYLNLFVFFMLLLVLGNNYIVMFAGWEGVGLCSYLLIGFWFGNDDYNKAANKAFIMNRIGDLGFLLGIILMFITFGSVTFSEVFQSAKSFGSGDAAITAITLLLFIGAMGKSAQIPLYTWLPDAMAGPTPVSALIHAATMVTAGIYMIIRSNILYALSPFTMEVIVAVGAATAIFSGTIAIAQTDIKKVLAYSTVSQLGYMFVALGVGAFSTGLFHVTTHAFFKALLFLAAGSVIHAMSGEQDIRKMGGLKKKLPITHFVFLMGTLAIAGVPGFSGFFSKDEILSMTYIDHPFAFTVLAITSVLTVVYMFRLYWLTFYGNFRGTHDQEHHLHESPTVMTLPLMVLAVLSIIGGYIGLPSIISHHNSFNEFISASMSSTAAMMRGEPSHEFEYALLIVTIIVLVLIIALTYNAYVKRNKVPADDEKDFSTADRVLFNKYYVDELYQNLFVKPLYAISKFFNNIFEKYVVEGVVKGVNQGVIWGSNNLRLVQSGNIGFYVFAMVIGIIAILAFNLLT